MRITALYSNHDRNLASAYNLESLEHTMPSAF